MKHKNIIYTIIIIIILLITGCSQTQPTTKFDNTFTKLNDSQATKEGTNIIINSNNQLAIDLYKQFNKENKEQNLFFSPYSIFTALTMVYEGARTDTKTEMQTVLHLPDNETLIRTNFAKLYNNINSNNENYNLSTANALWVQEDYAFLENYKKTILNYYGGNTTNINFRDAEKREITRQTINSWIEKQTNNKIVDMIPKNALNEETKLVLTNAIYFKGTWLYEFNKDDTIEKSFFKSSNEEITVPMMKYWNKDEYFNYFENKEIQLLELPYRGENISMLIILPQKNNINQIENNLTIEQLSLWKNNLQKNKVNIILPKFKFETKYSMRNTLFGMGMKNAFNPIAADFSGMDGTKNLSISEVIHQGFVEVNEEGTEAAAATAVIMKATQAVKPSIPNFIANHPFIFIIQQKENGNILFMGKIEEPVSK